MDTVAAEVRGRQEGRRYLVTVPRPPVEVTKEILMERVKAFAFLSSGNRPPRRATEVIISKEKHVAEPVEGCQNPETEHHFHLVVVLNDRYYSKTLPDVFRQCLQLGCNVKVVYNFAGVVEYVTKEDKDPLCFGVDYKKVLQKKSGKTGTKGQEIAELLLSGATPLQIAKDPEYQGFMLTKGKDVEFYYKLIRSKPVLPYKLNRIRGTDCPLSEVVVEWIRCYLLGLPSEMFRPLVECGTKPVSLWIDGRPSTGKSTLVEWLSDCFNTYRPPKQEEWHDLISSDTELILMDEYSGDKTLNVLNSMLDNTKKPYKRRGQAPLLLGYIPTIILANGTPSDIYSGGANKSEKQAYHYAQQLEALETRLRVVSLGSKKLSYQIHRTFVEDYKDPKDERSLAQQVLSKTVRVPSELLSLEDDQFYTLNFDPAFNQSHVN